MRWSRAEWLMLAASTLLGAVYFPTTGNLFITFCLYIGEDESGAGSWVSLVIAAALGALVGAVSGGYALGRAHTRVAEESIGSVIAPACVECFCFGVGMLMWGAIAEEISSARVLLIGVLSVAAACLCWTPFAFVRSLYFAWATLAFARVARERSFGRVMAAVLIVVLGLALSLGSVRVVPAECSQVLPGELVAAVARW